MLGSSILDVAIGMAFIYLLLALIASTIQEALSAIVQSRSANLEHGIRSLFSGGKLNGDYFVDLVYKHGLVRGLYQDPKMDKPDTNDPDASAVAPRRKLRPGLEAFRKFLGIKPSEITKDISDPFLLPAYIPARTFAITVIELLHGAGAPPADADPNAPPPDPNAPPLSPLAKLNAIEAVLKRLCKPVDGKAPNKATAEALLALLADARTVDDSIKAAERFRANIENWYNDAMDRVSGWYKKYTQKILLCIGLILAIAFNVDSITVGKTLWFDHDARQGLVNAAGTYVEKNTPDPQAAKSDGTASTATAALSEQDLAEHMKKTITAFNDVSGEYLLPVGWHASLKWGPVDVIARMAGWIITALALSLGAPFWFDTLNKFMVVRSTVKPQEKSLNEPSKS